MSVPSSAAGQGSGAGPELRPRGYLHMLVAFDWGDQVDLERARQLFAGRVADLARRRRTPPSIMYRRAPVSFDLPPVPVTLSPARTLSAEARVTIFDMGAASVALRAALDLSPAELLALAGELADPQPLLAAAKAAAEPVFENIRPAIQGARWVDLSEEYVVLQLLPGPGLAAPADLLATQRAWLAGLVCLEPGPLSALEVDEALKHVLTYSPDDLLVAQWSAAVLVDTDCDETLQVIEFANVQLLEFRYIDRVLDDRLEQAYELIHPLGRQWLPYWRLHWRPLRDLGELKVDAHGLLSRTSNVLKVVGDQYLGRVYRLVSGRFHTEDWGRSISQSLSVAQEVYRVLSDQAAVYRTEFLEIIVIALIALEIIMAVLR